MQLDTLLEAQKEAYIQAQGEGFPDYVAKSRNAGTHLSVSKKAKSYVDSIGGLTVHQFESFPIAVADLTYQVGVYKEIVGENYNIWIFKRHTLPVNQAFAWATYNARENGFGEFVEESKNQKLYKTVREGKSSYLIPNIPPETFGMDTYIDKGVFSNTRYKVYMYKQFTGNNVTYYIFKEKGKPDYHLEGLFE
jgi:hypothetical protein